MESTRKFDPRFDPAFQPGFEGVVAVPVDAPVPVEGAVESRAIAVDAPLQAARANPWVPALWVVAAVLIVLGVAGQTIAEVITAGPTADTPLVEYVIPALLRALSPWLLVAGLLAGIGVMFVHAIRWRE